MINSSLDLRPFWHNLLSAYSIKYIMDNYNVSSFHRINDYLHVDKTAVRDKSCTNPQMFGLTHTLRWISRPNGRRKRFFKIESKGEISIFMIITKNTGPSLNSDGSETGIRYSGNPCQKMKKTSNYTTQVKAPR